MLLKVPSWHAVLRHPLLWPLLRSLAHQQLLFLLVLLLRLLQMLLLVRLPMRLEGHLPHPLLLLLLLLHVVRCKLA